MRPDVDLALLRASLRSLSLTPYFNKDVLRYSNQLSRVIDYALDLGPLVPEPILRSLAELVWIGHQYLSGSTSKEAPYEVQFCLERALNDWAKKKCIITTGLTGRPFDYHFFNLDPWQQIRAMFPGFNIQLFDAGLILIGVPRLYRHKPVFCIPLYHELGHFIDLHWGVSNLTVLRSLQAPGSVPNLSLPHWAEHFADLFSACYVGPAGTGVLTMIADHHPSSTTHPATRDRSELVRKFLAGEYDPRLEALQQSLKLLSAPALVTRYTSTSLIDAFSDLRPVSILNEPQLHGMFADAWDYFVQSSSSQTSIWTGRPTDVEEVQRIVNDLAEKSIRNYSIKTLWDANATPQ